VPFDTARFDSGTNELHVEASADALDEVHVDQFARFSDADLLTAMFSPAA
jgi:hypothetical protein